VPDIKWHPFVVFIRDLPGRSQIQASLSKLEADSHLNVNILLYSIWFALTEQGRLRRVEFKKLLAVLHPWDERIHQPLKQLAESAASHQTVHEWVDAEKQMANEIEQHLLAQALPFLKKRSRTVAQQLADASHSLVTYCKIKRVLFDATVRETIQAVLEILFFNCTSADISASLDLAVNTARIEEAGFTQLKLV